MIFGALLLCLIGSAVSILTHVAKLETRISSLVLIWVAAGLVAHEGYGLGGGLIGAAAVAAPIFVLSLRRPRTGVLGVVVLGAILAASSGLPTASSEGRMRVLLEGFASPLVEAGLTATALAVVVGLLVYLGDAGNAVVRCVLELAGVLEADGPDEDRAFLDAVSRRGADKEAFRGGRYIGALERWLVMTLLTVGALPMAVALLAAKGVVRFPEVSRDVDGGQRAEYFLVGTLTSLGLALGATGLLMLAL